ncbi:MAG TPA: dipeptide epimerase [Candidatus Acidoferrum sp.]|nr:dipeptide epimerase [Candidatus Acidoferrum sp.]
MKLDFLPFELRLKHKWAISSGLQSGQDQGRTPVMLVRLTDGPMAGWGEAPATARYQETTATITAFLGRVEADRLSFANLAASMDYLEKLGPGNYSAKGAVNVALADGAARLAGQPVYDFLNLGFTEGKHLTSLSIGLDTPKKIREKVLEADSFPVLKLKIGGANDRKNLAALREAAPLKTVRVDANEAWATKEEALRKIEWLAQDPHIEYIEQPMPAAAPPSDLAWLKQRSPLPVFGDESYHHAGDAARCAECYHGVNVKLIKTGGILQAAEALKAARRAGLKTMIGCMVETSISTSAGMHLAELADHLDLDGNLLVRNDPFAGPTVKNGILSFADAKELFGLRIRPRKTDPLE